MNVFEKLQLARVELQNVNLKKTGKNVFSGYDYFELRDFLPTINSIFLKLKLFSYVTFSSEIAILTVLNIEKPDEVIKFTSPMADAQIKGCHPIQNLGAIETYQRRYLYMTALEIVESDVIDNMTGSSSKEEKKQVKKVTRNAVKTGHATGGKSKQEPWSMTREMLIKFYDLVKSKGCTDKKDMVAVVAEIAPEAIVKGEISWDKVNEEKYNILVLAFEGDNWQAILDKQKELAS